MLHENSCLISNMPKIMIIKHQQFAKTNTFSFSFHILFSPFLHIFPHFSSRHIEIRILGWAKMGLDPPLFCTDITIYTSQHTTTHFDSPTSNGTRYFVHTSQYTVHNIHLHISIVLHLTVHVILYTHHNIQFTTYTYTFR